MFRTFLTASIFLLVAGCLRPAWAWDFRFPWLDLPASFDLTETLVFDYHDENHDGVDDNDDYFDLRSRLNLKLAVERLTLSIRLDTSSFFSEPAPAPGRAPYLDRYAPEKISATWADDDLRVELGDFYASIGRGFALRIRKTDQLGEDTTLLGAKLRYRFGDLELVTLSGLSNPSNTDLYEKTMADPYDLISAAQAKLRLFDILDASLHAVHFMYDPLGANDQAYLLPDHSWVAGAGLSVPDLAGWASLAAEFNWLGRQLKPFIGQENGDFQNAWAGYLSASVFLGNFTLLGEFKSTDDFYAYTETASDNGQHNTTRLNYLRPPTLEPEQMEVGNNHDVTGGRLRLDWRPGAADTVLFGSLAYFAGDDGSAGKRLISHSRLGAEQRFLGSGRAVLAVGLREEHPDYAFGHHVHLVYVDAELKVPVSARHSLELHGTHWMLHELIPTRDYHKGEWTLGYAWSPWFTASAIFAYDNGPSVGESFAVFHRQDLGPLERQLFLAGSLSLNLWSQAQLRLLFGQLRGGLKCIDGACRVIPPFAGVRTELTLRF